MKKTVIASMIALGMFSGYASAETEAASGQIEFVGAVTAATCDMAAAPMDGGFNTLGTINLGTVKVGALGEEKAFSLKPKNPAEDGCVALSKMNSATVKMSSGAFTPAGLGAVSGSAKDAYVKLTSVGAKQDVSITAANKDNGVEFAAANLIADGFQFKAALQGGQEKGDFRTAANFTINYQ